MALKTILWVGFFAAACLGALGAPVWGIVGYIGHYCIGADRQWWNAPLSPLGIRYSLTLAFFTAIGILLNWGKRRFGRSSLVREEKLLLLFLGIVWLLVAVGPGTIGFYTTPGIDHPSVKLTKMFIFVLMLTHVVTDLKNLNRLLWVMVVGALILGLQAFSTPYGAFVKGRLESVGGPDFGGSNYFAAFMAGMLFLIGAQFLRSGWKGKAVCFLAGGFTANAIILARSRAAFLGVLAGVIMAVLLAPRRHRLKIFAGLLVAGLGGLYLTDPGFLSRASTVTRSEEQRDSSAESRFRLAAAGVRIVMDHPLGVGPGNFFQTIGEYIPEYEGRDAHNTFVRCATELGLPGLAVLCALVLNAALTLRRTMKWAEVLPRKERSETLWASYGMACALAAVVVHGLTHTLLYTEFFWWFLALPVCLTRAVENAAHESPAWSEEALHLQEFSAEGLLGERFAGVPSGSI
jgi:putative inorganic carbon (HCO3(-)) transporter